LAPSASRYTNLRAAIAYAAFQSIGNIQLYLLDIGDCTQN